MLHAALPRALNSQVAEGGGLPQLDPEMDPGLALRKHLFGMLTGDKAARGELKKLFAEHDVNWDVLTAVAFQSVVVPQLHTDRMAGNARERRRAAYAELDRLRAIKPATAVARRRTVAPDDAVDVEEVAAPPTAPNTSAASAGNGSGRTRAVFSRG
jgi:hypothetical protein